MLTGQLPSDHGVHTHNLDFGSINQTVLDELEGYQRIGVSANGYANSNFNFDGYFDEFFEVYSGMDNLAGLNVRDFVNDLDDDLSITSYISFLKATLGHEQTIASLRNGAKALLNERLSETNIVPTPFDKGAQLVCKTTINRINESSEPFFAFMNVMDAHEPHRDCLKYDESKYDVPFGWSSDGKDYVFGNTTSVDEDYFKELYGASIDYLDRVISSFVRDLRSRTNAETTIIISADHGDNLREPTSYGQWGHVYTKHLTDGLLHVPLAIINPPSEMNMDPSRLISHLDLPDLFRDFAGLKNFSQDRKKIVAETIGTGSLGRVYMDEDISEEEYQEWDQSLRLVEKKTVSGWSGTPMVIVLNTERGTL